MEMRFLAFVAVLAACGSDSPPATPGVADQATASDLTNVADLGSAPDIVTVDDLARAPDLDAPGDLAPPPADLAWVGRPCTVPPISGGCPEPGAICDVSGTCQPCGANGAECCQNAVGAFCDPGFTCNSCDGHSAGKWSRCQSVGCGSAGAPCCYDWSPFSGAACGNGPPHPFCVGFLACNAGVCG